MAELFFEFKGYSNLWLHEVIAISDYMDTNDPAPLAALIQENSDITPDMRRFIADLVTGKIKRKAGKKPSTFKRNFEIYEKISDILSDECILTSNRFKEGAFQIIADEFEITEDLAKHAYYDIKKLISEANKINQD